MIAPMINKRAARMRGLGVVGMVEIGERALVPRLNRPVMCLDLRPITPQMPLSGGIWRRNRHLVLSRGPEPFEELRPECPHGGQNAPTARPSVL